MLVFVRGLLLLSLFAMVPLLILGCSKMEPTKQQAERTHSQNVAQQTEAAPMQQESEDSLTVITFGNDTAAPAQSKKNKLVKASGKNSASESETIISHLKELQILLGTWRGITKKNYGGFKAVDQTEWVWDFQSEPQRPALVMTSSKSPYYRNARMTYLPADDQYQLTLIDADEKSSHYLGTFSEPIEDVPGDNKNLQRSYKLEFTQTDAKGSKPIRFVFNQKDNNRYLLEYYQQRGAGDRFFRLDTVSTQREGTSFALIDEGYGEKTCIISGGLGTSTVSYKGKTYYVCCSGCKSAFEDDPARWVARAEEQMKKK
ncbi:MAG: YHS domain-containing protein [Planctomycetaceae bacterium]|nr:YHS domain-containing protein [Planctomycetaceae bacterium]